MFHNNKGIERSKNIKKEGIKYPRRIDKKCIMMIDNKEIKEITERPIVNRFCQYAAAAATAVLIDAM